MRLTLPFYNLVELYGYNFLSIDYAKSGLISPGTLVSHVVTTQDSFLSKWKSHFTNLGKQSKPFPAFIHAIAREEFKMFV